MSDAGLSKALDGYEDDFEKDLDWLIGEENRSEDQVGCWVRGEGLWVLG